MDYKNTLNLPNTGFPMKADLVNSEPKRLKKWEVAKLYRRIQEQREKESAKKFVLHDGPPFANGNVHIGTALNKILKDIIVKYKTLRGFSAPYVPGWDCHGLPIEYKVMQDLRSEFIQKTLDKAGNLPSGFQKEYIEEPFSKTPLEIREKCKETALNWIEFADGSGQKEQFKRLGILGDWDNPYLTLNKEYEADELRLFADIVEKGFVYRGKKPVYWSIPCRTALAEAEVEYKDHVSPSIYVKFQVVGQPNTFVLIWTTTPWTLPANLAVAYNHKFQYVKVKVGEENYILSKGLLPSIASKCGWNQYEEKPFDVTEFIKLEYFHPFCNRRGGIYNADFVTNDTGTGFVHIAPGHGLEDYQLGKAVHLPIYSPVDDDGRLADTSDLPIQDQMPKEMVGKSILEKHGKSDANEAVLHELRTRHALLHQENYHHSYPHCWRSKTPVIFRAMDQWFIKVDHCNSESLQRGAERAAAMGLPGGLSPAIQFSTDDPEVLAASRRAGQLQGLRGEAINAIESKVNWIPSWGKNRILAAVISRPDWCISRQRTWGVPIPFFYDVSGNPIPNPSTQSKQAAEVVEKAAELIREHGSDVWFEKSAAELWSLVKPKDWTGAEAVNKSNDTLDVWIDSGSSSRSVLMRRAELQHRFGVPPLGGSAEANATVKPPEGGTPNAWQADVYLEGSDQHRGWFQSSLLLSLAGNGAAPFKTVLTHGFMVDADREKISKSKQSQGGYEKPQTSEAYIKKYGADIVRLWVSSQDFRNDIIVSEERIAKVAETYRGIRNALRYQLSNLYDFDPAKHTVPDDKLTGLDRWILGEFSKLEQEVVKAYDDYEFHVVYQKVSQFIAVELSSIYHDVIKDRLYTDPANSHRRRSTQTALHRLVTGLCQMLAPILAFTADEAWEFVPGKPTGAVHESKFKPGNFEFSEDEQKIWKSLLELRRVTLPELEKFRQSKAIGKSLEAKLDLIGNSKSLIEVPQNKENLRELLNVSQLKVQVETPVYPSNPKTLSDLSEIRLDKLNLRLKSEFFGELVISVSKADGQKCERCWHWETDVGSNPEHPTICGRCVEAVKQFKV